VRAVVEHPGAVLLLVQASLTAGREECWLRKLWQAAIARTCRFVRVLASMLAAAPCVPRTLLVGQAPSNHWLRMCTGKLTSYACLVACVCARTADQRGVISWLFC
jgi:hypothetical protein